MHPFRGGIAHYTDRLVGALAERCDVVPVSFRRQYPAWLYPGKSDVEPHAGSERRKEIAYILDATSPRSLRRTADYIASSGCRLALFNWWTLFWAPGFAYVARRLRSKGIRTAFLCHNLADHDAGRWKKCVSEWLLGSADAYVVHTSEQAMALRQRFPGRPVVHRLHPVYDHFPAPERKLPKRGRLELLFFGFLRPYKGLNVLVEALSRLQDHEVFLTVAGEAWGNAEALCARLRTLGAPNLELLPEYIDPTRAADFFGRADVVVLPYLTATGSGVATVAYHYRKPVLATRVGGLKDSVIPSRTGWLVEPDSPTALASAIAAIDRQAAQAMVPSIDEFCRHHTWAAMADSIIGLPELPGQRAAT